MKPWSYSLHQIFKKCRRQFYFTFLAASHNAKDPFRKEAFILKQLQHISSWRGSIVHSIINKEIVPQLKFGQKPGLKPLKYNVIERAHKQFYFSAEKKYREMTKKEAGENYCALFEHEYELACDLKDVEQTIRDVIRCLENLYNDKKEFLQTLENNYKCEGEVEIFYEISGARATAKIDILSLQKDKAIIVDWKVSESIPGENRMQLLTYALALSKSEKWSKRIKHIEICEYNLLLNKIWTASVEEGDFLEAEDFVFCSIEEMKTLVQDQPYKFQLLEEYDIADSIQTCIHCNYKKICLGGGLKNALPA